MARPVDDDANIAAVWDDDRMADIGRLLRGGPALLRGIKKGVKAVARLFLAVLICDFLVGVGGHEDDGQRVARGYSPQRP